MIYKVININTHCFSAATWALSLIIQRVNEWNGEKRRLWPHGHLSSEEKPKTSLTPNSSNTMIKLLEKT